MYQVTTKLEVNIRKSINIAADAADLATFMIKNKIPAVVVDPEFLELIMIERNGYKGPYKVICTVDFETGKAYAMDKLINSPKAIFEADGVEFLLTPNKNDKESLNELKCLHDFMKRINPLMEVRWVFGFRTRSSEQMKNFYQYLKNFPANYIRTDPNVEVPAITVEQHQKDVNTIKEHVHSPIKVSGNITLDMINKLNNVSRYDVNVKQAKKIIKDLQEEEEQARVAKYQPVPQTPTQTKMDESEQ